MKASSLSITDTIKQKLLFFPVLVDSLQNKDPLFLSILDKWMKEIETIFKDYNIARTAEIAGFRSKIIAPLFGDSTRVAAKKKQIQIAAEVLYDLQNTVLSVLTPYESNVQESREIFNQLLGLLKQTGAIKYSPEESFQLFIDKIWNVFTTHEQLKPSTFKILTLIPQSDAVRIIAEEIELKDWL